MANEKVTFENVDFRFDTRNTADWSSDLQTVIPDGFPLVEKAADGVIKMYVGDGVHKLSELKPFCFIDTTQFVNESKVSEMITAAFAGKGTIFTLKGTKATFNDLPTSEQAVGDVWLVGSAADGNDSYEEYYWSPENKWEYMGKTTDFSNYYDKTKVDELLAGKVNKTDTLVLHCKLPAAE